MTSKTRVLGPVRDDTALIIVDMQERLLPAMPEKPRKQMLRNAGILIETAKALGLPILVSEQYPKGLGPTVDEIAGAIDNFKPLEKMVFSAARDAGFRQRLDEVGRSSCIVTGVENHVCVLQTALDLAASGKNVYVARDATCSRTEENWKAGCAQMAEGGVQITTTEILVFQLLGEAGTEAFKKISKLVR
ncbi:MAG: hydrolase [Deltaproteobacteria bacterium]|nr:hydrolase [Deltaproteobacteria bacterium]